MTPDFTLIWPLSCLKDGVHLYLSQGDTQIAGHSRDPSNIRLVRHPGCGGKSRRDGFARDCPHRHPVRLMLALRDRSGAAPSFFCGCRAISTVAGAAPRRRDTSGARWRRYAGDRLAGRFPWSGWGARESLPGHPSHGRRIGPRHGPMLSPSPSVVAPARVASRGHPGLSRIIPG